MRVVVVGGGIAGASAAYWLARGGAQVTVIDEGAGQASRVPSALLNPVRGQSGAVDARALAGLAATWALVEVLLAAGYAIPHGRGGVLRPLPNDAAQARFVARLPAGLPHRWLPVAEHPPDLGRGWAHVLEVSGGGWLDGAALVRALLAASGAERLHGRATAWTGRCVSAELAGQLALLPADAVLWAGGSRGAELEHRTAVHRPGTVLRLDRAPERPLSSGGYLAPAAGPDGRPGGVLGATFEAPQAGHAFAGPAARSLAWLLARGEALWPALGEPGGPLVTGLWSGVRLSGLRAGRAPDGGWVLDGLGSKGFLLGPLLAAEVAQQLLNSGGA